MNRGTMSETIRLPQDFHRHLDIPNAAARLEEAMEVGEKMAGAGIPLLPNPDHAAIFSDPPHLVAGPLRELGYVAGWDARCYPSPVDGHDYINVPSGLPGNSTAREQGWFDYVAVVHPVDQGARDQMLRQGQGNPFVHHITWGISSPNTSDADTPLERAGRIISFMARVRTLIPHILDSEPGTLIMALPGEIAQDPELERRLPRWLGDLAEEDYQVETMQGGGFLLQFFVLTGGRIEVALRSGTRQTFNPKSVHKISRDEISTDQLDNPQM
jgi:hypothetical protein